MTHNSVCIFWDESHIWGIMAWRAIRAFGLSCRLVKSREIAQGGILGKGARLLLVPGGGARLKSAALGAAGRAAIRSWLASGGIYIGICGGAGLALKQKREADGLGICPWKRGQYASRLFHLLSGNVMARTASGDLPLPIWWPGRFAPAEGDDVHVLASYQAPAPDLWLADLPLEDMPNMVLDKWRRISGFEPRNIFPPGHPLVVEGRYGKGRYLLSYAHLETPQSEGANRWLGEILEQMLGLPIESPRAPAWNCWSDAPRAANFAYLPLEPMQEALQRALYGVSALINRGVELGLLFRRNSWLMGWRPGLAGMSCNNLLALLQTLAKISPTEKQKILWERGGTAFMNNLRMFLERADEIFWSARLAKTIEAGGQQAFCAAGGQEIAGIFGHPMLGGGVAGELLVFLEELLWLGQENAENGSL